jgi:hypothetical protein
MIKFILRILAWVFGGLLVLAGIVVGVIIAVNVFLYFIGIVFAVCIIALIIYGLMKLFE